MPLQLQSVVSQLPGRQNATTIDKSNLLLANLHRQPHTKSWAASSHLRASNPQRKYIPPPALNAERPKNGWITGSMASHAQFRPLHSVGRFGLAKRRSDRRPGNDSASNECVAVRTASAPRHHDDAPPEAAHAASFAHIVREIPVNADRILFAAGAIYVNSGSPRSADCHFAVYVAAAPSSQPVEGRGDARECRERARTLRWRIAYRPRTSRRANDVPRMRRSGDTALSHAHPALRQRLRCAAARCGERRSRAPHRAVLTARRGPSKWGHIVAKTAPTPHTHCAPRRVETYPDGYVRGDGLTQSSTKDVHVAYLLLAGFKNALMPEPCGMRESNPDLLRTKILADIIL
ncbi:hypothetical protein DFH09DRAFT_1094575 [Mycena vulgaris]|nr:hypothetical protein DFH09DRAFT_1094575 [Mycena vulgaris]